MSEENPNLKELVENLMSLGENAFPLSCPKCHKVYPNIADYLQRTLDRDDAGGSLKTKLDDETPITGVFRECACGEPLFALFQSRRDESDAGQQRRVAFDKLVQALEAGGLTHAQARDEVLNVMRGGKGTLMDLLQGTGT